MHRYLGSIKKADIKNKTKMNALLSDATTYKKEKEHLTSRVQESVNKLVLKWHRNGKIDINTENNLTCYNDSAPFVYGIPKGDICRYCT